MLLYRLNCKKNTESKNLKVESTKIGEKLFHQNVECVIVKNRNLSKSQKLADYLLA